jgi:hypothetical protein
MAQVLDAEKAERKVWVVKVSVVMTASCCLNDNQCSEMM